MPVLNGKETLRQIRLSYPEIKVIMISYHKDEATMIEFLSWALTLCFERQFVRTFCGCDKSSDEGYYHNKSISKCWCRNFQNPIHSRSNSPSTEKQIIALTCQGKTNKQIADHFEYYLKTVDYHKTNIYKKPKPVHHPVFIILLSESNQFPVYRSDFIPSPNCIQLNTTNYFHQP